MKALFTLLFGSFTLFSITHASIFSHTITPQQLVGRYDCQGDDAYYKDKYVGSFTFVPNTYNKNILIYEATYGSVNDGVSHVTGLAYVDGDFLILAFNPGDGAPPGAGDYRISGDGKYLTGKYLYLVDPKVAVLGNETCKRVE